MLKIKIFFGLLLLAVVARAQINTPAGATMPFNSNTGYEFGLMPTNLPSGGTYGKSQDAANAYNAWKTSWLESCTDGTVRVKFDVQSETVSEGIAYGMLLSVYAADKTTFDDLYAYYKKWSNSRGVMNWKISGCASVLGQNGATDAELDAAMALIVAEYQWPDATSPYNYATEATNLITAIKNYELHPSSFQTINGDGWGFTNTCRNPSYQSPAYYKQYAGFVPSLESSWNSAITAAYTLLNANAHTTTGLVSNWSDPNGVPNSCNGQNEYGYDACRNPWRMATDVLWYNDTRGKAICNKIASYTQGVGAGNVRGPIPQAGGTGQYHNSTFVSTFAAGVMGADATYQTHLNNMYSENVKIKDGTYFGETLRAVMLFMQTGNFWKPGTIISAPVCTSPALGQDQSLCGLSSVNLNHNTASTTNKTFKWHKNGILISGETSGSYSVTSGGTYKLEVDSLGCVTSDEVVISSAIPTPTLGPDRNLCDPASITLDAGVTGSGISYSWLKDNIALAGKSSSTLSNVRVAGTYKVTLSASGCTSVSDQVIITSSNPVPVDGCLSTAGSVDLAISDANAGPYEWFGAASGGLLLGSGTSFTTPYISSTKTYYVQDAGSMNTSIGPSSATHAFTSGGGRGPNTNETEVVFNAHTAFTLVSIKVRPYVYNCDPLSLTFELRDASNNVLATATSADINNPCLTNASPAGYTDVVLNLAVPAGTGLRLKYMGGNNIEWYNGGATYPMEYSGIATITGPNEALVGWAGNSYAGFFDWQISTGSNCARLPVIATISANCSPTGLVKEETSAFAVYPNPVSDGRLYISDKLSTSYSLKITDLTGLEILAKDNLKNNSMVELPDNLGQGIYVLYILRDEKTVTFKIIITR